MKTLTALTVATIALFTLGASANAQTLIGVSFNSGGQPAIDPATETAGLLPQLNFNVFVGDPTAQTLNYDNGASSGASITVNGYGNYFSSGSFSNPGDQHLFDSNYNHNDVTSGGIAVSSIPFATYDLYVYGSSDNNSAGDIITYKLTQGASVQTLSLQVMNGPGTYVQSTNTYNGLSTTAPGGIPFADYVEFTGLTASSFTLQFGGQNYSSTPGSFNAGLDGFQIVEATAAPEPSTWAMMLGGLGLLGFCIRRKTA